jgi:hypothetical protein
MNDYFNSINNPISLGLDEKIVENYSGNFNLPVEVLINNSENTRLARRNNKHGTNVIPRRQNAWIIYLRDKSVKLKGFQSSNIAKMWGEEPKEIVEVYEAVARLSVRRHIEKYGTEYRYRPKPKKNNQNQNQTKNNSCIQMTPPISSLPTPPNDIQFPTLESVPPVVILEHMRQCRVCQDLLNLDQIDIQILTLYNQMNYNNNMVNQHYYFYKQSL